LPGDLKLIAPTFTTQNARKSLTTELVEYVRARIKSGELAPGNRLPTEKVLIGQLGVSRTVIREAVARLTAEGLVQPRQGSGVFITDSAKYQAFQITQQEMVDVGDATKLLELRLAVETETAGLAAERRTKSDIDNLKRKLNAITRLIKNGEDAVEADFELHVAIAQATGNQYFVRFMEFIGVRLVPPRSIIQSSQQESYRTRYLEKIQGEHIELVEAIISGNARGARAAARTHLLGPLKQHNQLRGARELDEQAADFGPRKHEKKATK
jgi:GntR family transcriptional regulator, transcriptional repressor for pyruvate dehydrogenase complex